MRAPNARALLMGFLREHLSPGVQVVAVMPSRRGGPVVRVVDTGGAGRHSRVVQEAQVTIDSYDKTPGLACELALRVDGLVHGLPASALPITRVGGTHPADYPDPDVGPRYTATYQLSLKLQQ